jgi:hypothetical protein
MPYKFVIKAHESSHVPEDIYAPKNVLKILIKKNVHSNGSPVK